MRGSTCSNTVRQGICILLLVLLSKCLYALPQDGPRKAHRRTSTHFTVASCGKAAADLQARAHSSPSTPGSNATPQSAPFLPSETQDNVQPGKCSDSTLARISAAAPSGSSLLSETQGHVQPGRDSQSALAGIPAAAPSGAQTILSQDLAQLLPAGQVSSGKPSTCRDEWSSSLVPADTEANSGASPEPNVGANSEADTRAVLNADSHLLPHVASRVPSGPSHIARGDSLQPDESRTQLKALSASKAAEEIALQSGRAQVGRRGLMGAADLVGESHRSRLVLSEEADMHALRGHAASTSRAAEARHALTTAHIHIHPTHHKPTDAHRESKQTNSTPSQDTGTQPKPHPDPQTKEVKPQDSKPGPPTGSPPSSNAPQPKSEQPHVNATTASPPTSQPEPSNATSRRPAGGPKEQHVSPGGKTEAGSASEEWPVKPEGYLAVCLAVRDQHADIREWIEHHRAVGASKIYVYDTNSSVRMDSVIQDFINSSYVEYSYVQSFHHASGRPQLYVYEYCLQLHGPKHNWLAFLDADEFLVLKDPAYRNLPSLLREYEEYGALAVNWQMFGSSGHKNRPPGSTLQAYHACLPRDHHENRHVKIIANTRYTLRPDSNPHIFVYKDGKHAVNENFEPVLGPKTEQVSVSKVALYHYVTKSLEEYRAKMARGSGMGNKKTIEFFVYIESQATVNCAAQQ